MAVKNCYAQDQWERRDRESIGIRSEIVAGPVSDWAADFSHLEPEWSADPYPIQDEPNTPQPSRAFCKPIMAVNPRSKVLMFHDLYTLGVPEPFRAFSDHPRSYSNVIRVLTGTAPSGSFEAEFYVDIHHSSFICPTKF